MTLLVYLNIPPIVNALVQRDISGFMVSCVSFTSLKSTGTELSLCCW